MKTSSAKAKGRSFQVLVAETFSRAFCLTIEAAPPTKTGIRNGVCYVAEGAGGDLRVRNMGQAGSDIALLSAKARQLISIDGTPLYIECKCQENSWDFGPSFWKDGPLRTIDAAFQQTYKAITTSRSRTFKPLIVLGKNRHIPIAVWESISMPIQWPRPYARRGSYNFTPLEQFCVFILGAKPVSQRQQLTSTARISRTRLTV